MLNFKKTTLLSAVSAITMLATLATADAASYAAKVNGVEIPKSELEAIEKALPDEIKKREPDEKKRREALLKDLIGVYLIKDAAIKAGIEKDPQVQEAIGKAKEQVLMQAFLSKQLQDKLTEKALKDKYDEFAGKFPKDKTEAHVYHILVASEKEAKDAIDQINSGKKDFNTLASTVSLDKETGKNGGDLDYILEDAVPEFAQALKDMKPGQITMTPVKTSAGYHVLKLADRRKAKPPKFDDMKPLLARVVEQGALQELVQKLRDKATIEMPDSAGASTSGTAAKK